MARDAVFPGSFDPLTYGHTDIVLRGAQMFDKIYVAVGHNTSKNYLLSFDERQELAEAVFEGYDNIKVVGYQELTVTMCRRLGAKYILRGLRSGLDYEYERSIAFMNNELDNDVETVFLLTKPELSGISSTIVREIVKNKGDISQFVPKAVAEHIASGMY